MRVVLGGPPIVYLRPIKFCGAKSNNLQTKIVDEPDRQKDTGMKAYTAKVIAINSADINLQGSRKKGEKKEGRRSERGRCCVWLNRK